MSKGLQDNTPITAQENIAVIGCGYWGQNLIRIFAGLGVLHSICDNNPQTISRLELVYPNIRKKTDFKQIMVDEGISGVAISTPVALHYGMAKQALEAGKDVFVEKPLSLTVQEGEELVKTASEMGKILMVGHLLEYHPGIIKLKELVDNGELGNIKYIYSNRLNLGTFRTEENILWSFAPHDVSIILLLLEELPEEVSASGGCYLHPDIADITITTMGFRNGIKAHIFVSWLHPYKEQKLVVIGDKKMAVFDDVDSKNKLLLYEHRIEWIGRKPVPHKQEAIPIEFAMAEPLEQECRHFIDCIISRREPKTNGYKGLQVLQVLAACQKSLQEQGIIVSLVDMGYFAHPTSLVEKPNAIGEGTNIWHFSHVMPNVTIGKNCNIGQNVFIGKGVSIGDNVKIQNNVSIFEGVALEDDVFCGPSCVFTNVNVPRSQKPQRGKYALTKVKKGATIGANATIICGNTIGKYSFIGAGAVVTKDVPDYTMFYGNPAQIKGWVCECGTKLNFDQDEKAKCVSCDSKYTKRKIGRKFEIEKFLS